MTFWSGEKLLVELPKLIDPYHEDAVDCASYRLSIGREIYVSPTDQTSNAKERTARKLTEAESFAIPSGQFAFLLTEETVSIPDDAISFISMRAGTKFRGLMNVSGFHVDPGYTGKLLFAVFNAGPAAVHLKQGDDCFLIWYASLDRKSKKTKTGPQLTGFPVERINPISGELQSFEALSKRISNLEREGYFFKTVATIVLGLAITYLVALLKECKHDVPAPSPPAPPVQIILPANPPASTVALPQGNPTASAKAPPP